MKRTINRRACDSFFVAAFLCALAVADGRPPLISLPFTRATPVPATPFSAPGGVSDRQARLLSAAEVSRSAAMAQEDLRSRLQTEADTLRGQRDNLMTAEETATRARDAAKATLDKAEGQAAREEAAHDLRTAEENLTRAKADLDAKQLEYEAKQTDAKTAADGRDTSLKNMQENLDNSKLAAAGDSGNGNGCGGGGGCGKGGGGGGGKGGGGGGGALAALAIGGAAAALAVGLAASGGGDDSSADQAAADREKKRQDDAVRAAEEEANKVAAKDAELRAAGDDPKNGSKNGSDITALLDRLYQDTKPTDSPKRVIVPPPSVAQNQFGQPKSQVGVVDLRVTQCFRMPGRVNVACRTGLAQLCYNSAGQPLPCP